MSFVQAKCPECGGMLAVDDSKKAAVCQFCGEAFIVQEAINNYNTYNITNNNTTHNYGEGAVVNVYEDNSKDFVIEAGVLKEYHGAAIDVVIPNGVVEIGEACFKDLKIKTVVIPDSVTSIESSAFSNCTSLTKTNYIGDINSWVAINFGSYDANPINNSKNLYINNELVTEANITTASKINAYTFYKCTNLTDITIPNSVTSIGHNVFYGCTSLTSINVDENNNSYASIDGVLFNKDHTVLVQYPACKADTEYTIPNSVTSIGYSAFCDCTNLTTVTIPDSVTSIGDDVFGGCSSLTSVTIPSSVTSIGRWAFNNCTNLTSAPFPNSVVSIGDYAFLHCTNLTTVTIPDSVTSIGWSAFENCTNLTSITIPSSVTSIGWFAFKNCTNLTSVTLPNSVVRIGDGAFQNCSNILSIISSDTLDGIFYKFKNAFDDDLYEKIKEANRAKQIAEMEAKQAEEHELLLNEKVKVFVNIAEVHLGGYFLPSVAIAANQKIIKI